MSRCGTCGFGEGKHANGCPMRQYVCIDGCGLTGSADELRAHYANPWHSTEHRPVRLDGPRWD